MISHDDVLLPTVMHVHTMPSSAPTPRRGVHLLFMSADDRQHPQAISGSAAVAPAAPAAAPTALAPVAAPTPASAFAATTALYSVCLLYTS